jgi:hypothetical protein
MSKKQHSRIYLKSNDKYFKIMNIFSSATDDSIALSFYGFKKERLFGFQDNKRVDIETINETEHPKISFHQSGIIKLTSMTSKNNNVNRITWKGTPFEQINKPCQMMEIFLPPKLLLADKAGYRKDRDVILDAANFPNKQWRITLFCTHKSNYEKLKPPWANTSECEYDASLERNNLVWSWVLRVSRSDIGMSKEQEIMYFIPGEIKWPKQ